ncbi:hypothetical protein SCALM49S_09795 [Streptomyces californicus]
MALWDRIKESASSMQTQLEAKKNELKSGSFREPARPLNRRSGGFSPRRCGS